MGKYTFRNSGTPVRRTRRRKSQQMHFQGFWVSCAQNPASEISKNALLGILGILCAEQSVGNLKKTALLFEQASCPGQLRSLGQNCSQKTDFLLNKPLVLGSFAAWGRTFSQQMSFFLNKPLVPGSFVAWGQNFLSKNDFFLNKPLVRDLCAEQDVGNLEK